MRYSYLCDANNAVYRAKANIYF